MTAQLPAPEGGNPAPLQGFVRAVNVVDPENHAFSRLEVLPPSVPSIPKYLSQVVGVTETEIVEFFGRFLRVELTKAAVHASWKLTSHAPSVHPGEGLDDEIPDGHVNHWHWCRPSAGPPHWICQLHSHVQCLQRWMG